MNWSHKNLKVFRGQNLHKIKGSRSRFKGIRLIGRNANSPVSRLSGVHCILKSAILKVKSFLKRHQIERSRSRYIESGNSQELSKNTKSKVSLFRRPILFFSRKPTGELLRTGSSRVADHRSIVEIPSWEKALKLSQIYDYNNSHETVLILIRWLIYFYS